MEPKKPAILNNESAALTAASSQLICAGEWYDTSECDPGGCYSLAKAVEELSKDYDGSDAHANPDIADLVELWECGEGADPKIRKLYESARDFHFHALETAQSLLDARRIAAEVCTWPN